MPELDERPRDEPDERPEHERLERLDDERPRDELDELPLRELPELLPPELLREPRLLTERFMFAMSLCEPLFDDDPLDEDPLFDEFAIVSPGIASKYCHPAATYTLMQEQRLWTS
jgi:hypothetical protein